MAGSKLATGWLELTVSTKGAQKQIASEIGGAGEKTGKHFSAGFAGVLGGIAGVASAVTSKAFGAISNSMGAAISRVDTMNNFPKIMKNLGYSSDAASKSIAKMSTKLTGLPTSLDSMTGMVQQLAPLTGGLGKATDLSLALNNALLAGGKSTDIQANAMDQYTQMLSVGKVDMAAWRSMVTAMPGQVNQLAKSLLGANANQTDLYNAMQSGKVSFDDFNDAILGLNKKGLKGYASFSKQAKDATTGIATSQANLGTAITRGLANVMNKLRPQITGFINGLTAIVNAAGPVVVQIVDGITAALGWMADNMNIVIPILAGVAAAILTALVPSVVAATTAAWAFTTALLANPLVWVAVGIAALVAGIVALILNWKTVVSFLKSVWNAVVKWLQKTFTDIFKWWNKLWSDVGSFLKKMWGNAVKWLQQSFTNLYKWWRNLWTNVGSFLSDTWKNIKGFFKAALDWVLDLFLNWTVYGLIIKNWDHIKKFFSDTWRNIKNGVKVAIDAVKTIIHNVTSSISTIWRNVWKGISSFFSDTWANIKRGVGTAIGAVKTVIHNVTSSISRIWHNAWKGIGSFFKGIWDGIVGAVRKFGGFFRDAFSGIKGYVKSAFSGVLGVVRGPMNGLIGLINGAIRGLNSLSVSIPSWVPIVGGQTWGLSIPSIPYLATGAIVPARAGGVPAVLGEGRYDEMVVPLGGPQLAKLGRAISDASGGRGDTFVLNGLTTRETAEAIATATEKKRRRRLAPIMATVGVS